MLQRKTQTNLNWPQTPDYPYRILIIGCSEYGKTNALLNLKKQQVDDDNSTIGYIYLYVKNPNEVKYQYLIKKYENNDVKNLKDPNAFIEYTNNMQDAYKNIEEYNPSTKCNVLIVFDDMIADMISNKKLSPVVTDLLIRGRQLTISFPSIKDVSLNCTVFYYEIFQQTRALTNCI